MMKYKILAPTDSVIYKDDGRKLVLFTLDREDEEQVKIFQAYDDFVHTQLFDILFALDYNKSEDQIYTEIRKAITSQFDPGAAIDISETILDTLYVADLQTGNEIFRKGISDIGSIIEWRKPALARFSLRHIKANRKWLYITIACIAVGIIIGLLFAFLSDSSGQQNPSNKSEKALGDLKPSEVKYKINAVYDPKTCTIYFNDTKFETVDYYIDYQNKIKKIDDINWKLQANTMNIKDTLFLKDDCTVYVRGEKGEETSEVHVFNVSYLDFITELLVTQDPLIESMLVTNSPIPFGNTIFMVDGVPQQVSYYKSSELRNLIKKGFRVTSVKAIGSNLNPTNKQYSKLSKITIQK